MVFTRVFVFIVIVIVLFLFSVTVLASERAAWSGHRVFRDGWYDIPVNYGPLNARETLNDRSKIRPTERNDAKCQTSKRATKKKRTNEI